MKPIKQFLFTLILACSSIVFCYGQSAEELFKQGKDSLAFGNVQAGVILINRAAVAGLPEAEYALGTLYQQGNGVEKNDTTAAFWMIKASENGWRDAQYQLAYLYAGGKGVQHSLDKAFEWSLKCAWLRHPECMQNVINCYGDGTGTEKSMDSVITWMIRLGKLDAPSDLQFSQYITYARVNLATMYQVGDKVKKDAVRSYAWYLLYNETKRDFAAPEQKKYIDIIKMAEKKLKETERKKAREEAVLLTGRPLKNLANLFQLEVQ
ncbi:MAG: tetratricopeptide repeat protein [Bacteroidetes bacterium]|nr:tetratricopeptide repeat protein [Bacteroidota bacterium]